MTRRYDIVIIGAGNAGFGVAAIAAEAGKKIAFVEKADFGGTCPNRGCLPKKILVAAARAMHEISIAKVHGIKMSTPILDWSRLIDREQSMIALMPDQREGLARKQGDVFQGHARFVGPTTIAVEDIILDAKDIVIATGSKPRPLSIDGAEALITSDDVLSERALPCDVVFIGGGVIAMEFSHVYARAGVKVTVLEAMSRVLSGQDMDAVTELQKESERIGITINTNVEVVGILPSGEKLLVDYIHDRREMTIEADRVINGTGRVSNIEGLNLEAGAVRHDGIRIDVDPYLRSTSNPSVWVCGDALFSSPQLSPVASYEGRVVGRNIVDGPHEKPDYGTIPSCVFTIPVLASVGLSEAEAVTKGFQVRASVNNMSNWFSSRTTGEPAAWAKILVEKGSARILGAHILGHGGEEIIHIFALAMKHNITAPQLKNTLFAFPTYSSDFVNLL